jgi:hypothetical protein
MRLVEVVEDTTMLVSGYEHQTWQCSDCSSIEQGMTFTRKRSPTPSVTVEHARTMLAKPAQTVPIAAKRSAEFKVFWDNLRFWIAGCTDTPAAPTPFRSLSLGGFPLVNLLGCFHPGIRR